MQNSDNKLLVYDMGRYRNEDGPGIRTIIFLKGCPLRCRWCSNPFGLDYSIEIAYNETKCVGCGRCVQVCPQNAVSFREDGKPRIDYTKCIRCEKCVGECPAKALKVNGEWYTLAELYAEGAKDVVFYRRNEGGVTLSGGEVLSQYKPAAKLLAMFRESFIHTAVETSGFAPWEHFEPVLRSTSVLFMDLKHIDTKKHKELTGVPNELILDNMVKACDYMSQRNRRVVIRYPLIPTLNDADEEIKQAAEFVKKLTGEPLLNFLPYHNLGETKYAMVGKKCDLPELPMLKENDLIMKRVEEVALQVLPRHRVSVGGGNI